MCVITDIEYINITIRKRHSRDLGTKKHLKSYDTLLIHN